MSKSTTRSRTATNEAREDKTKATTKSTMTKPSATKAKAAKAQATATRKPAKRAKDDRVETTGQVTDGTPSASSNRRPDTKQARLIAMLEREEGASIAEIAAAFAWQAHTVRGAIAGALKKKLGLAITSDKVEGRARVYRIATA